MDDFAVVAWSFMLTIFSFTVWCVIGIVGSKITSNKQALVMYLFSPPAYILICYLSYYYWLGRLSDPYEGVVGAKYMFAGGALGFMLGFLLTNLAYIITHKGKIRPFNSAK